MFDDVCAVDPGAGACQAGRGTGQNQWYHLDRFVAFLFDYPRGAFLNVTGPPSQNPCLAGGATSCLKGQFVRFVGPNATVGSDPGTAGDFSAVGIQLIK
jgi:hypothetical protein